MKKFYIAPEIELDDLEIEDTILAGSIEGSQGGGIGDDNSTDIDPTPSTDPDNDFGW